MAKKTADTPEDPAPAAAPTHKGGRQKITFTEKDYEQMKKLAEHMWSIPEIAGFFDCTDDTLAARILEDHGMKPSEFFAPQNNKARGNLRSAMWRKAMGTTDAQGKPKDDGDKGTQIFLSKNYLGMSDRLENTVKGDPVAPLNIQIVHVPVTTKKP